MEKTRINLEIILPEIPGERDECVKRLISELRERQGMIDVHVVPASSTAKAQLCFHYDPEVINVDRVRRMAQLAGAKIVKRYHHLLVEVEGFRHQRQTRTIENTLKSKAGVLSVSASGSGMLAVEFDTTLTTEKEIRQLIKKQGLRTVLPQTPPSAVDIPDMQKGPTVNTDDHHHETAPHKNRELLFSILCGALLGTGFVLSLFKAVPSWISLILYIGAYFFGGFFTAKEVARAIVKGGFEIDFLMLVAATGAAILGDWAEGALLLFLFSMGHALEHYAMEKARKSIAALTELVPKTALLKKNGDITEVKIEQLVIGDTIVVKPNTKISADGIVVLGSSSVNQAPITGESIPVDKEAIADQKIDLSKADSIDAKHRVYAGTINGNESLEVRVSKATSDSTLSRLVKMVNEAQTQKSPTQQFTDKFEKKFVPIVLVMVLLLCFAFLVIDEPFSKSFYRAISVLVVASPCALAISTPSAVLSGVARAARAGVLIKGGKPLEDLGNLTALAFDKTGTLTEGKPRLTQMVTLGNITEMELLKMVVSVEALSDHPIARAIVRDGKTKLKDQPVPTATDLEAVLGKGIKAKLDGNTVYTGNLALFESLDAIKPSPQVVATVRELEKNGNTTMLIRVNNEYQGVIAVMDTPRPEAKEAIAQLRLKGIKRMIMLTGDNQNVADNVAKQIGIDEAWGGLLPEQKVDAIKKLRQEEKEVAMVGDGVNDAPAMANSTVGIAMGAAGSDVALETADIALLGDKLELLPFAIGLSRKSKTIIRQNVVISLGVVVMLIPLTLFGIASIGPAVVAHEGSTLIVVLNALRLLAYKA